MAKKEQKVGGILVGAGCLIGLGIGMMYGRPDVGVLIGLGVGLLGMFIYVAMKKK
ncbi:hypothetical protein KY310_01515 [Candidatus Woesearchaeota archaeon]|nr:hypothetical protein [Candidatus Woesearchaeota archaeon]